MKRDTSEEFIQVQQAWEVLRDPEKRRQFDQMREYHQDDAGGLYVTLCCVPVPLKLVQAKPLAHQVDVQPVGNQFRLRVSHDDSGAGANSGGAAGSGRPGPEGGRGGTEGKGVNKGDRTQSVSVDAATTGKGHACCEPNPADEDQVGVMMQDHAGNVVSVAADDSPTSRHAASRSGAGNRHPPKPTLTTRRSSNSSINSF